MCAICGCSGSGDVVITDMATGRHTHLGESPGHRHAHGSEEPHSHSTTSLSPEPAGHHSDDPKHATEAAHSHHHSNEPNLPRSRTIRLETEILQRNNHLAERNRGWFEGREILAINLMSSPGAGKTTLLERTIRELGQELQVQVIEGDQETLRDAERIRALGSPVIQINTGAACHLDAEMVSVAVRTLNPPLRSTLFIENVGNLVCPALFDLGERLRVVIASVTEGDDKPAKYPQMFRAADLIVLNKIDLLPHVEFDLERFTQSARQLNPEIVISRVSATRGEGLTDWYDYLRHWRDRPAT